MQLFFNNKGADQPILAVYVQCEGSAARRHHNQPALTRSLISDFVVQSLKSIIDKLAIHTKFQHSS